MFMRNFLSRQITRLGYFIRSARTLGLLMIIFISPSSHASDAVTGYVESEDTVRPASGALPGNVSNDEFRKRALAQIREFQGCLFILNACFKFFDFYFPVCLPSSSFQPLFGCVG